MGTEADVEALPPEELHVRATELARTVVETAGMHEDYYILARAYLAGRSDSWCAALRPLRTDPVEASVDFQHVEAQLRTLLSDPCAAVASNALAALRALQVQLAHARADLEAAVAERDVVVAYVARAAPRRGDGFAAIMGSYARLGRDVRAVCPDAYDQAALGPPGHEVADPEGPE